MYLSVYSVICVTYCVTLFHGELEFGVIDLSSV